MSVAFLLSVSINVYNHFIYLLCISATAVIVNSGYGLRRSMQLGGHS